MTRKARFSGASTETDKHPATATKRRRTYRVYARPLRQPRNTGAKPSSYISEQQALNLVEAVSHASVIDYPINWPVTIHLEKGGLQNKPQQALSDFLKSAGKWLGYRGVPLVCVWMLEDAGSIEGKGLHAHILLHIPYGLERAFAKKAPDWLRQAGINPDLSDERGKVFWLGNKEGKPISGKSRDMDKATTHDRQMLLNATIDTLRYHMKGIEPTATPKIMTPLKANCDKPARSTVAEIMKIRPVYQGIIHGKRVGTSENIGPTLRKRWAEQQAQTTQPIELARAA